MRKIADFFRSILVSDKGSLSSKRLCGLIGWIVILGVEIGCAIAHSQAPEMTEGLMIAVVTLLGVESVTSIFKKGGNDEGK